MVPLPGAGAGAGAGKVDSLDMSPDITRLPLSLDTMDTLARAQERVTGVYTALVDSGLGDLYNRVLCPTCIVQILIINTMVVSGAVCRYLSTLYLFYSIYIVIVTVFLYISVHWEDDILGTDIVNASIATVPRSSGMIKIFFNI